VTQPQASAVSLTALLIEEQRAVARLLALLAQEQLALANGKLEEITALAIEKAVVVGCSNGIVARRTAALRAAGFRADAAGMEQFFATHYAARTCQLIWAEIVNAWHHAAAENQLNDELARLHLARTERALSVLRQSAASPSTYGPDGRGQTSSSIRTPLLAG
jgi:flagellar biosynthesis protein FlgN